MRTSLCELHKNTAMAANMLNLVLVVIITLSSLTDLTVGGAVISQCEEVKNAYVSMGYSPLDVPASSIIEKGMCVVFNFNFTAHSSSKLSIFTVKFHNVSKILLGNYYALQIFMNVPSKCHFWQECD